MGGGGKQMHSDTVTYIHAPTRMSVSARAHHGHCLAQQQGINMQLKHQPALMLQNIQMRKNTRAPARANAEWDTACMGTSLPSCFPAGGE